MSVKPSSSPKVRFQIFTDGGSRSNPGPAGVGVWIKDLLLDREVSFGVYLGKKTNNEAEYLGLLAALKWLQKQDLTPTDSVEFYLDSKLVIEQIQKNWKIKQDHLQQLADQCWQVTNSLPCPIKYTHVKRDKNKTADELANLAMDLGSNLS
ncbi:MAG: reverse transcriptase-like protein [Candidatus Pacebacteria bacterium]|nr:reverse transcriptase-like protein [Candidatus Paceibacterota bacterium]